MTKLEHSAQEYQRAVGEYHAALDAALNVRKQIAAMERELDALSIAARPARARMMEAELALLQLSAPESAARIAGNR